MPMNLSQQITRLSWPLSVTFAIPLTSITLLTSYARSVIAMPLQNLSSSTSSQSGNSNPNTYLGFQILADGTQDLAALVGLFATEGVERYAIDYTRGLLPPSTAPLSMLGLLGYVRTLLKLSFGVDFCERTGFSTFCLRSYAGVKVRSSHEMTTDVHYLQRTILKDFVQWEIVKTVVHTRESMPLTAGDGFRVLRDRRTQDPSLSIAMCFLDKRRGTAFSIFGLSLIVLTISTALSSFSVLLFPSGWDWTRFFATAGLTLSVLIGGLPWCIIYIIEQLPFGVSDWFRSDWKNGATTISGSADGAGKSLERKNTFAYFSKDDHFYIFDCHAVGSHFMRAVRTVSLFAAISITVAYICQYIELRKTSPKASAIWLGLQGLLAILRVLAWCWAPAILGMKSNGSDNTIIRWADQRDNFFKDSLTELEITLCWASTPSCASSDFQETQAEHGEKPPAPLLPKWLVQKMDDIRLQLAFKLSSRLRTGNLRSGNLDLLQSGSRFWDMPDHIFARWLQLRCGTGKDGSRHTTFKRHMGVAAMVCRIILDRNGSLHMMPGVSLWINSEDVTKAPLQITYFSCFKNAESNVFCTSSPLPFVGAHHLYQGIETIPEKHRELFVSAQQALQPLYQTPALKLWAEILLALKLLGLADDSVANV